MPVSVVRAFADSGDAFLTAVVTKGRDVVSVAHLGRKPTAYQRTALEWSQTECTVLGCTRRLTQIDHRADWAATHRTPLDGLDALCHHHHNKKTRENWALVDGTGKRAMVPPGHADHPTTGAAPSGEDHRPTPTPPERRASRPA